MPDSNIERMAAVMPPDGSDLTELFAPGSGFSIGGLIADDATIRFLAGGAEQTMVGPEGFVGGWADWLEPWETYRIHYEEVEERGDRVIALVRLEGVTKRGGVEMEQEAAGIFHFRDGQVVEIEFNLDREDAVSD